MSGNFEPIRINALDTARTRQSPKAPGLRLMYLTLSASPSSEWVQLFDNQRSFPRHSMWREARVQGSHIVVDCVPEELEQYHLRDLKEDVVTTNAEYEKYLTKVDARNTAALEQQRLESERLDALKDRLKFD